MLINACVVIISEAPIIVVTPLNSEIVPPITPITIARAKGESLNIPATGENVSVSPADTKPLPNLPPCSSATIPPLIPCKAMLAVRAAVAPCAVVTPPVMSPMP